MSTTDSEADHMKRPGKPRGQYYFSYQTVNTDSQFVCAGLAVGAAARVYLGMGDALGRGTASWLCILCAAPLAAAGFFNYNGMTLE